MPPTIADLLRAASSTDPPPKRRRQAASQSGGSASSYASTYRWSEAETQALEQAEALRRAGRVDEARQCLSLHDMLPQKLRNDQIVKGSATVDVSRWYEAFMGDQWDGTLESLKNARMERKTMSQNASRRVTSAPTPRRLAASLRRVARHADLLMEGCAAVSERVAVDWPSCSCVGHLRWDCEANAEDEDLIYCRYCDALLLKCEAKEVADKEVWLPGRTEYTGRMCCNRGSVRLPAVTQPEFLRDLWLGPTGRDVPNGLLRSALRKFARPISNALALASQTVAERQFTGGGRGGSYNPSVVLEGRVVRRIGSLLDETDGSDARRSYAQMYIHDALYAPTETEDTIPSLESRLGRIFTGVSATEPEKYRVRSLVNQIALYVQENNPHVQSMVMAVEEAQNLDEWDVEHAYMRFERRRTAEQRAAAANGGSAAFDGSAGQSAAGRHGAPLRADEIRLMVPSSGNTIADSTGLLVKLRNGGLTKIGFKDGPYDALYHVLLHPNGELGWESHLKLQPRKYGVRPSDYVPMRPRENLSLKQYYSYRLHWRRGHSRPDNCLFMAARLFQEYACVGFWRVEADRLQSVRDRLKDKRIIQQNVCRTQVNGANGNPFESRIGRHVVLPESFVGSPRDMNARYHDTMTCVMHDGPPSVFLTFTANPKWAEITNSLAYGQSVEDRPDVVARVFHAKLQELREDIEKKHVLGTCKCLAYTVEFQKRGLPHAHIVVILDEGDRIRSIDDVNGMVSAELPPLPDPDDVSERANTQRTLRELVLEHMVHNDCSGPNGKYCPCYDEKTKGCRGDYPKPHVSISKVGGEHVRTSYRRRVGPEWTAQLGCRQVNNKWIVPYNPWLLLKYRTHLNVEAVTGSEAVKYLYKYIYKGSDHASAAVRAVLRDDPDEVSRYERLRAIGSAEAFWRMFGYEVAYNSKSVLRMYAALPGEHNLTFMDGEQQEAAGRSEIKKEVEAFVQYCQADARDFEPDAAWSDLTILQFPLHYVYDDKEKMWQPRKRGHGDTLGRLYAADLKNNKEKFYLRLLLTVVTGKDVRARRHIDGGGVDSLREAENDEIPTFETACRLKGLKNDDTEWRLTLLDCCRLATSKQLLDMMYYILLNCAPEHPKELFDEFAHQMGTHHKDSLLAARWPNDDAALKRGFALCAKAELHHMLDADKPAESQLKSLFEPDAEEQAQLDQLGSSSNGTNDKDFIDAIEEGEAYDMHRQQVGACFRIPPPPSLFELSLSPPPSTGIPVVWHVCLLTRLLYVAGTTSSGTGRIAECRRDVPCGKQAVVAFHRCARWLREDILFQHHLGVLRYAR